MIEWLLLFAISWLVSATVRYGIPAMRANDEHGESALATAWRVDSADAIHVVAGWEALIADVHLSPRIDAVMRGGAGLVPRRALAMRPHVVAATASPDPRSGRSLPPPNWNFGDSGSELTGSDRSGLRRRET